MDDFGTWLNAPRAGAEGWNGTPGTNAQVYSYLPAPEMSAVQSDPTHTLTPDQVDYGMRINHLMQHLWTGGYTDAGNNLIPYLQQTYGDQRVPEAALGQIEQAVNDPNQVASFARNAAASLLTQRNAFAQGGQGALTTLQRQMATQIPKVAPQTMVTPPGRAQAQGGTMATTMGMGGYFQPPMPTWGQGAYAPQQRPTFSNPYMGGGQQMMPRPQQSPYGMTPFGMGGGSPYGMSAYGNPYAMTGMSPYGMPSPYGMSPYGGASPFGGNPYGNPVPYPSPTPRGPMGMSGGGMGGPGGPLAFLGQYLGGGQQQQQPSPFSQFPTGGPTGLQLYQQLMMGGGQPMAPAQPALGANLPGGSSYQSAMGNYAQSQNPMGAPFGPMSLSAMLAAQQPASGYNAGTNPYYSPGGDQTIQNLGMNSLNYGSYYSPSYQPRPPTAPTQTYAGTLYNGTGAMGNIAMVGGSSSPLFRPGQSYPTGPNTPAPTYGGSIGTMGPSGGGGGQPDTSGMFGNGYAGSYYGGY